MENQKMAFLSRHEPTQEQTEVALEEGYELIWIGDADAFLVCVTDIKEKGEFDAVAVVHPAAAMGLCTRYKIGVFKNINRAELGEKPQFECDGLCVWSQKRRI